MQQSRLGPGFCTDKMFVLKVFPFASTRIYTRLYQSISHIYIYICVCAHLSRYRYIVITYIHIYIYNYEPYANGLYYGYEARIQFFSEQESLQRASRASAPPVLPADAPSPPLEVAPPAWGNWSQSSRDAGLGARKTWRGGWILGGTV